MNVSEMTRIFFVTNGSVCINVTEIDGAVFNYAKRGTTSVPIESKREEIT
jgi:hypothetical protein